MLNAGPFRRIADGPCGLEERPAAQGLADEFGGASEPGESPCCEHGAHHRDARGRTDRHDPVDESRPMVFEHASRANRDGTDGRDRDREAEAERGDERETEGYAPEGQRREQDDERGR